MLHVMPLHWASGEGIESGDWVANFLDRESGFLQLVHHRPHIVQRMLVSHTRFTLVTGDFGLEVVVVRFFGQTRQHLDPGRLLHEKPEGVVSPGRLLDLARPEKFWELGFQGLQVISESGPHHNSVGVDGLTVLAIPLASAHRTEEAMFGENPHAMTLTSICRPNIG